MTRTGRARQKSRRRSAVKVVDDVVTRRPDLPRQSRSWNHAAPFEHHDVVCMRVTFQHGRDPVFNEDVDLCVRQEPAQREQRRRRKHGVADRTEPDEQHPVHLRPVPARRR